MKPGDMINSSRTTKLAFINTLVLINNYKGFFAIMNMLYSIMFSKIYA